MGSSNRGQLRPHFGSRSPPFLVAALCVGLGIMGVSYYSLSNQYTSMESQLLKAVRKNELINQELDDLKKQLEMKSEDFDRNKVIIEKKESEIKELKKQVKEKDSVFEGLNTKLKTLEKEIDDNRKKLEQGNEMQKALESMKDQKDQMEKDLHSEIEQLKKSNDDLRSQIKKDQELSPKSPSSDVKSDKGTDDVPVQDPSYRSKLNADTDIEAGAIKPNNPGDQDAHPVVNDVASASPILNKPESEPKVVSIEDKVEDNKVEDNKVEDNAVDTNNSKEVRDDEFPFPDKTNEEISKGSINENQENNHVNNVPN